MTREGKVLQLVSTQSVAIVTNWGTNPSQWLVKIIDNLDGRISTLADIYGINDAARRENF